MVWPLLFTEVAMSVRRTILFFVFLVFVLIIIPIYKGPRSKLSLLCILGELPVGGSVLPGDHKVGIGVI